jgi:propionyl-CoA carboxylase beta chain
MLSLGVLLCTGLSQAQDKSERKKKNKKEIAAAEDPGAKLLEKEAEYAEQFATPYGAAKRGFIDEVILPQDTRRKLIKAFSMLENKVSDLPKRKHGNIPL